MFLWSKKRYALNYSKVMLNSSYAEKIIVFDLFNLTKRNLILMIKRVLIKRVLICTIA